MSYHNLDMMETTIYDFQFWGIFSKRHKIPKKWELCMSVLSQSSGIWVWMEKPTAHHSELEKSLRSSMNSAEAFDSVIVIVQKCLYIVWVSCVLSCFDIYVWLCVLWVFQYYWYSKHFNVSWLYKISFSFRSQCLSSWMKS